MLPSVYVSPLKLHSATKINLHGASGSTHFRNHLKFRPQSPVLRKSRSKYREMQSIPLFLSAMQRGVPVAKNNVVTHLLNLT